MAENHEQTPAETAPAEQTPAPRRGRFMDRSAVQLAAELAAGTLDAADVTAAALAAAEANTDLGVYVHVDPEAARARAAALDEARRRGDALGALHGLPLALKDVLDVAGMPTGFGSQVAVGAPPAEQDDPQVPGLREAGAVGVGKNTVPEFALDSYSENLVTAPARNPLDPARTAGGSSGGAAAAVAAGMLPLAPGNDGGGSVRIPAAACGLVGLKPGRGTVPTDRPEDTVQNLTCTGPLAHTAEDAALLFDVQTGMTRGEGQCLAGVRRSRRNAEAGDAPSRALDIGVSTASPFAADLEITLARPAVEAVTRAAVLLGQGGHRVDEVELDYGEDYHRDFRTVWTSGLLAAPLPEGAEQHMGAVSSAFLRLARGYTPEQIEAAVQRLSAWSVDVRRQLAAQDVVLTPVLAFAPPRIGAFLEQEPMDNYEMQCRFTPYTSMVNVLGLPAVSVPVLEDDEGLSWSVQMIGRPGTEQRLLSLAARLEVLLGR